MQTINQLSKRVGLFVAVYICLLVLINLTGFKSVYHQHFINMGNAVFASFNNGGIVTFRDGQSIDPQKFQAQDSQIILISEQQKKRAYAEARKVGIGYVLIQLFFYVKMWASLNLKFSVWYEQFQVGWTNDFFINLLNYFHIIVMYPFFGLVLITLISLLLNSGKLMAS